MLKSIFQINSKLILTAIFCLITSVSYAADTAATKSQISQSQPSAIENKPNSMPEWFYKELLSIKDEIKLIDKNTETNKSIRLLEERLEKVEVKFEGIQKNIEKEIDKDLKPYLARITDTYASIDRFGYIASFLGLLASVLAVMLGWISAGKKAKSEAEKRVSAWLEDNEANLTEQLDKAKIRLTETLESEIVSAKEQIKTLIIESKNNIGLIKADVADLKHNVTEAVLSDLKDGYTLTKEEKEKVTIEAKNISNKSDSEKTVKDWRALAIEHYFNGEFNDALDSIIKVFKQEKIKMPLSDYERADILSLKGVVLGKLKNYDKALDVFTNIVKIYGTSKNVGLERIVATALANQGGMLSELNRPKEAIDIYTDIVKRFGENNKLRFKTHVAQALNRKGVVLGDFKKLPEACNTFSEVIERFGESNELMLQKEVAIALFNKGLALGQLNEKEKAIDAYDDVIKRFDESKEVVLQDKLAKALINKGLELGQLNKLEKAIDAYDDVIKRFGESKEVVLQEIVVKALSNKAELDSIMKYEANS